MQTEYLDERGYAYASDVTPRPAGTTHLEPFEPGATTIKEAKPLFINGEMVTAELTEATRHITIFVGTKIVFQGVLPEEVERGAVNSWIAQYVLNPSQPREVEVVLCWLSQKLIDGCEWYKEAGQPAIDVEILTAYGDHEMHMVRDRIHKAGIMTCADMDLVYMVASSIEVFDLDVSDLVGRGCVDDLEEELVKILAYAQKVMPQLKIMIHGDDQAVTPTQWATQREITI
jgi:hypothetical protein